MTPGRFNGHTSPAMPKGRPAALRAFVAEGYAADSGVYL
jgi:hypothetical protein